MSENVEIDRRRIQTERVLNRLSGDPPLPDHIGNWKADLSRGREIASYSFQGAGDFNLIISRLGQTKSGHFFEYDSPWVSVEERRGKQSTTVSLLDLVDVPDEKREKEACDLAIDWMMEHQSPEEIRSKLEAI